MEYQRTLAIDIFEGPNIFCSSPVIRYQFKYQDIGDKISEEFVTQFTRLITGGANSEFGKISIDFKNKEHIIAALFAGCAVELQRQTGCELIDGFVEETPNEDIWNCFIPFSIKEIGLFSSREIFRAINFAFEQDFTKICSEKAQQIITNVRSELKEKFQDLSFETPASEFIQIAENRGIPWKRIRDDKPFLHFAYGKYRQATHRTVLQIESQISAEMANNKELTTHLLADTGLPVAKQVVVTSGRDAHVAAKSIGYPVAVKPLYGMKGFGVSPKVSDPDALIEALKKAHKFDKPIIIEKHIEGQDYRLQITGGKFESGILRTRAMVVGDGILSVEALADKANMAPWRWDTNGKLKYGIQKTEDTTKILARHGYDWNSIPKGDEKVYLQDVANSSQGGDYQIITTEVHPENAKMAERAAAAIGLHIAGVDFITTDISKPYWETDGAICEVNLMPAIDGMEPSSDQPLYQFEKAFDLMFPKDAASIPTIFIVSNDEPKSVKWLKEIFGIYNLKVGYAFDDVATVEGSRLVGLQTSSDVSKAILWNPAVEAAILVSSPDAIRKEGLGFSQINCVILERMPQFGDGEAALSVMTLVAGTATKAVLYNQDDAELVEWVSTAPSDLFYPVSPHIIPGNMAMIPELMSIYETLGAEDKPAFLMALQAVVKIGLSV